MNLTVVERGLLVLSYDFPMTRGTQVMTSRHGRLISARQLRICCFRQRTSPSLHQIGRLMEDYQASEDEPGYDEPE